MKTRTRIALAGLLLLFAGWLRSSATERPARPALEERQFSDPGLSVATAAVSLADVRAELPNENAWARFLARQAAPVGVFIDPRSGAAASLTAAIPLVPGKGRGNQLTLEDLSRTIGR